MIGPHIKDRFFQRYGVELTLEVLREIVALAAAGRGEPDPFPGRERVAVLWRGHAIRIVWDRRKRFIYTFLPPYDRAARIAQSVPKRKRRR